MHACLHSVSAALHDHAPLKTRMHAACPTPTKTLAPTHHRMVEQRQLAERQRVAGNAAMAAGQWSEALRCYELGLESQRHSMVLHANAALAAIKIKCYVQAMEHCDKVSRCRASQWSSRSHGSVALY